MLLDHETLVNTQAVHAFLKVDGFFLSLPSYFELSFFYDIDVVRFVSLTVNNLVASVLFEHKRVHHSLNLSFGPMVQKGQLLEELDPHFNLLVFYLLQHSLILASTDHGKNAICKGSNSGSARLVIEEGEFTKTLPLLKLQHLDKPLGPLMLI